MNEIVYTDEIESLIKGIGEKALALSWLHTRSGKRYSYLNNYLAIPAIILSTVTGAGSIGFGGIVEASYIFGVVSILVSVISTLNSYFDFAKRGESHRITSVNYNKLYLQISIELSLPRLKRINVKDFMKNVAEQIVRLNELQPIVPDVIILEFKRTFKQYYGSNISIPEMCNGLVDIQICHITPNSPIDIVVVPIVPVIPVVPVQKPKAVFK